jgi:glycerophosphoryl diester phosphodiesterase
MSKRLVDRATEVKADGIALHHTLATPRVIEKAKVSDLKIVVWTVDDPSWIQRARSLGVDALITNDPDRMLRKRNLASAV